MNGIVFSSYKMDRWCIARCTNPLTGYEIVWDPIFLSETGVGCRSSLHLMRQLSRHETAQVGRLSAEPLLGHSFEVLSFVPYGPFTSHDLTHRINHIDVETGVRHSKVLCSMKNGRYLFEYLTGLEPTAKITTLFDFYSPDEPSEPATTVPTLWRANGCDLFFLNALLDWTEARK